MDIIRAQEQSRDLHEQFHNQVTESISGCYMFSLTPCHITLMQDQQQTPALVVILRLSSNCPYSTYSSYSYYPQYILIFFLLQLQRSQDGFSVVADYFGRGVFNKVRNSS